MRPRPPFIADWLLSRLIERKSRSAVVGDFREIFDELAWSDLSQARRWYWWQTLKSLPALCSLTFYWGSVMFKNYMKVAWRTLCKHKTYSAINISGLAMATACCLLIGLFVYDEYNFDSFHVNRDRLFRVILNPDEETALAYTPLPLGPALESSLPGVSHCVRLTSDYGLVRIGEESFFNSLLFADPGFFDTFTFPLLTGNENDALSDMKSVVITQSFAEKYFGHTNVVGQLLAIRLNDTFEDFRISAVAMTVPANSSIDFDIVLPMQNFTNLMGPQQRLNWYNWSFTTYIETTAGVTVGKIRSQLSHFSQEHDFKDSNNAHIRMSLQPVYKIHLEPDIDGPEPASNPRYASILCGIALCILLTACINYTTLSIGISAARLKEVGMRKVVGGLRSQLVGQFAAESLLLALVATVLAVFLAEFLLPLFNNLAGKQLTLFSGDQLPAWVAVIGLTVLLGSVGGVYPALLLSRAPVNSILKQETGGTRRNRIARLLVITQFGVSIVFLITAIVMFQQIDYLKTYDRGFDGKDVIRIKAGSAGSRVLARYRDKLQQYHEIIDVAGMANYPFDGYDWARAIIRAEGQELEAFSFAIDYNYLNLLGINRGSGRNFSSDFPADRENSVLVNEALLRKAGWQDALGKEIGFQNSRPTIIGVVKDFNFMSLKMDIAPIVMHMNPDWGGTVSNILVKVRPGDPEETLSVLRREWQAVESELPFRYSFMQEDMNSHYRLEERWGQIIAYSAALLILVSITGLVGLTVYSLARRRKEMAIRKVLGATGVRIATLLGADYFKLIIIANVAAWPIAFLAMRNWLQNFAYRTDLTIWPFIAVGAAVLAVSAMAISLQTVKAASANPLENLQYE